MEPLHLLAHQQKRFLGKIITGPYTAVLDSLSGKQCCQEIEGAIAQSAMGHHGCLYSSKTRLNGFFVILCIGWGVTMKLFFPQACGRMS